MIDLSNSFTRKHCGKYSNQNSGINSYPYRNWTQDKVQRRFQRDMNMSPFSPENFPLAIKYLVFDHKHSCVREQTIYSPQQYVFPTILYYLYLYFALLTMVTSSHLTTGGTPKVAWLLTSIGFQVGCGL